MPLSCGMASSSSPTMATPAVMAMAATAESVSVETNRPTATSPSMDRPTTPAAASVRPIPSSREIVVPDKVVTRPRGNSTAPARRPAAATVAAAARQNVAAVAILLASRRVRPTGRTRSDRRVPSPPSPAIESPATRDTPSGRKKGRTTVSPAIAAKTPLWETWARNAGASSPRPRGPPDSLTAMASRTGTPARAPRAARVRARLNSSHSSLANIEPLPGQRHEQLLQAGPVRRQRPQAHARADQGGGHVLGGGADQLGPEHPAAARAEAVGGRLRAHDADAGQAVETLGGLGGIALRRLDAQRREPAAPELAQAPLGHQLSLSQHGRVGADLIDLGEEVGRQEDGRAVVGQRPGQGTELTGAL